MYFADKTKNDEVGESKQKYKERLYHRKRVSVYFVYFFFFNGTLIKTSFNAKKIAAIFIRGTE